MNYINHLDIYRIGTGDFVYEIFKSNILGTGTYSNVYLGRYISIEKIKKIEREDNLVAIKKINITKTVSLEIEIMKNLINHSHPNIIKCYDIIDDIYNTYIIMEYGDNGDFSSLLINNPMSQMYIKYYFKQIIEAIKFLHEKKIVHRDIKPKNILVLNKKRTLKICDFGFATYLDGIKMMLTMCGSPLYMAPEIYQKIGYTDSVDVWSLGIMLYEMIFGEHPLSKYNDIKILLNSIVLDDIIIPYIDEVDNKCIDLLQKMIKRNEYDRIKIEDVFKHQWIIDESKLNEIEIENMFNNIQMYKNKYNEYEEEITQTTFMISNSIDDDYKQCIFEMDD